MPDASDGLCFGCYYGVAILYSLGCIVAVNTSSIFKREVKHFAEHNPLTEVHPVTGGTSPLGENRTYSHKPPLCDQRILIGE